MKTKIEYLFLFFCLVLLGTACEKDDSVTEEPLREGLYLVANSGNKSFTRSVQEGGVNSLHAFYFQCASARAESTTDADYTYQYHEKLDNPSNAESSTPIRLLKGAAASDRVTSAEVSSAKVKDVRVVFIANMDFSSIGSGKETAADLGLVKGTTTLDAFMAKDYLTPKNKSKVALWKTGKGGATSTYIPMYYCTDALIFPDFPYTDTYYINTGSNTQPTGTEIYALIRMLAKFTINSQTMTDVELDADATLKNFKIKEVALVNAESQGYVCHANNLWNNTTSSDAGIYKRRVTATTIPTANASYAKSLRPSASGAEADNKLTESNSEVGTWQSTPSKTVFQTIDFYSFETASGMDIVSSIANASKINNIDDNCYIYLKGDLMKKGAAVDTENQDVEFMLPIYQLQVKADSKTLESTGKPGSILRNHQYTYMIKGVKEKVLRVVLMVQPWSEVTIDNADVYPIN